MISGAMLKDLAKEVIATTKDKTKISPVCTRLRTVRDTRLTTNSDNTAPNTSEQ